MTRSHESVEARATDWTKVRLESQAILVGGFVAGTLDIGAACLINWRTPYVICQAIASGLFGAASFGMGTRSAEVGLLLQWFLSILIASIFVGVSQWLPVLRRRWIAAGCAYGVPVFVVMNYVVLPLSAVGHVAHFTPARAAGSFVAMIWFGFVIAFFSRDRASGRRRFSALALLVLSIGGFFAVPSRMQARGVGAPAVDTFTQIQQDLARDKKEADWARFLQDGGGAGAPEAGSSSSSISGDDSFCRDGSSR